MPIRSPWNYWTSLRNEVKRRRRDQRARRRLKDLSPRRFEILRRVDPFTMVGPERLVAYMDGVVHAVAHDIPGAIVECGVWKGGASMAAMLQLLDLGHTDREFYLYDTYEGMSPPSEFDISHNGLSAQQKFDTLQIDNNSSAWCRAEIDQVKQNVCSVGYPSARIHFVKGKVEDTIPNTMPEQIAVLRLDTDWYESTAHELEHLFPRLAPGGVLILDDYGHWQGVRKAVDEYLDRNNIAMMLHRSDYTGRTGIKPAAAAA